MKKFIPKQPDPFIKKASDQELAKFGHLNALVDEIGIIPKLYVAQLTQVNTDAPEATVIVNTLGETLTYHYSGNPGQYYITKGTFFSKLKTVALVQVGNFAYNGFITSFTTDVSEDLGFEGLWLYTIGSNGGGGYVPRNDWGSSLTIQIQVYP